MTGEIDKEDGVLFVRSIHVRYQLVVAGDADRQGIERAFEAHPPKCPVYKTVSGCVDVTLSLELSVG